MKKGKKKATGSCLLEEEAAEMERRLFELKKAVEQEKGKRRPTGSVWKSSQVSSKGKKGQPTAKVPQSRPEIKNTEAKKPTHSEVKHSQNQAVCSSSSSTSHVKQSGGTLWGTYNEDESHGEFLEALSSWRGESHEKTISEKKEIKTVVVEPVKQSGGALWGTYNEDESHGEFLEALSSWRGESHEKTINEKKEIKTVVVEHSSGMDDEGSKEATIGDMKRFSAKQRLNNFNNGIIPQTFFDVLVKKWKV